MDDMKRVVLVLAGVAVLAVAGCFRNERTELRLEIPAMQTEADAAKIKSALDGLAGAVVVDQVDLEAHAMVVTYDNVRLGKRNVETAVSHAGFAVNDWPAAEDRK